MAYLGATRNRAGLAKINSKIVLGHDVGFSKIDQVSAGLQPRTSGSRLQRFDIETVGTQAEVHFRHPGHRTVVLKSAIDFSQQDIALVAAMQQRITRIRRHIVNHEIKRRPLVIPNEFTLAYLELTNGKREQMLNRCFG